MHYCFSLRAWLNLCFVHQHFKKIYVFFFSSPDCVLYCDDFFILLKSTFFSIGVPITVQRVNLSKQNVDVT